jgi:hypothetical protein
VASAEQGLSVQGGVSVNVGEAKAMKTKFMFKNAALVGDIVNVYPGRRAYGGILFVSHLAIGWDDWDKLVEWVKTQRPPKAMPEPPFDDTYDYGSQQPKDFGLKK